MRQLSVTIRRTGAGVQFDPATPNAYTGDQIFWINNDKVSHQPAAVNPDKATMPIVVAVTRQIRLTEGLSLRTRAAFFNVANHTNFANSVADMGTNGGAAGAPRVIQFSLRLQF